MADKKTVERARRDLREGKRPSTAAGEFVHKEIEDIRSGRHGARSTRQAIAIGLSEARRAGIPLPPPRKGRTSEKTRQSAELAYETGQGKRKPRAPSRRRSLATLRALKRESGKAASPGALSRQARSAAATRSRAARSAQARKAAATRRRRTGRNVRHTYRTKGGRTRS